MLMCPLSCSNFCCANSGLIITRSQKCIWGNSVHTELYLLLQSLFGDTIPFPYTEGVHPHQIWSARLQTSLVDHLKSISACKDHNAFPLSRIAIHQPQSPFHCRSPKMRKKILTKLRSWPGRVTRVWGTEKTAQMALWMGADSSGRGGLDGSHL